MKGKKLLKLKSINCTASNNDNKKEREKEQLRSLENLQKENPDLNNSIITLRRHI